MLLLLLLLCCGLSLSLLLLSVVACLPVASLLCILRIEGRHCNFMQLLPPLHLCLFCYSSCFSCCCCCLCLRDVDVDDVTCSYCNTLSNVDSVNFNFSFCILFMNAGPVPARPTPTPTATGPLLLGQVC